MTTSHRPVSKTRVNDLTRDIRRDADKIRNLINLIDSVAKKDGTPIPVALAARYKARNAVAELLNEIDGTSALLRAELGLGERF